MSKPLFMKCPICRQPTQISVPYADGTRRVPEHYTTTVLYEITDAGNHAEVANISYVCPGSGTFVIARDIR